MRRSAYLLELALSGAGLVSKLFLEGRGSDIDEYGGEENSVSFTAWLIVFPSPRP